MNSLTPPTVTAPPAPGNAGLPIAAVERETGLGKDTLRVWERRYRFPTPSRDSSGDRLYSLEQVQQLKLISRLLDSGLRPGKVVGLGQAALHGIHRIRQFSLIINHHHDQQTIIGQIDRCVMVRVVLAVFFIYLRAVGQR